MEKLENINIDSLSSLPSPKELKEYVALSQKARNVVLESRKTIQNILTNKDPRTLIVAGPCSIHDPKAAYEYAEKLAALKEKVSDRFFIVMRVYFEKPRTTVGWKGLINDPDIDQSYQIDKGLSLAREILGNILDLGLPTATEMLDTIVPHYISDLVCWASLGARTTESQPHREMTSGLSMPVGFKNGTNGDTTIAMNAIQSAQNPHCFVGTDKEGQISLVKTTGNQYGHIILRGGTESPNYDAETIQDCIATLKSKSLCPKILVDCSHGNSRKKHVNQPAVFNDVMSQIKTGNTDICGVMIESNLNEGNQSIPDNLETLKYGVSITDECMSWDTTEKLILSAL